MEDKLEIAKEILKKYNQEHLLHFYDELSKDEKNRLLDQILTINFEKILTVYKQSLNFRYDPNVKVSPIPHVEKDKLSFKEIEHYSKIGEAIIKSNQFAVVTMAGGQGTRLGYKGPKGTYMLNLKPVKKSLFQIMAENSIKQQRVYLEMADEIKKNYPNINVLKLANDKNLEDTEKELRDFLKY